MTGIKPWGNIRQTQIKRYSTQKTLACNFSKCQSCKTQKDRTVPGTKETWQLNAVCGPALGPRVGGKLTQRIFWVQLGNLNMVYLLDNNIELMSTFLNLITKSVVM